MSGNMSLGLGKASGAASALEKDLVGVGRGAAGGIPMMGGFASSLTGLPLPALAAAAAVGALYIAGKSIVDISDKWEASQRALKQATDAGGVSYSQARGFLDQFIASNTKYISSQNDVVEAYATLTRSGLGAKQAQEDLNLAMDLAALKHIPLTAAAEALTKVEMGKGKALVDLGINMKDYPILMEDAMQADKKLAAAVAAVEKATLAHTAAVKAHGPASAQAATSAAALAAANLKLAEAHNYAADRAAASTAIHDLLHQKLDKGRLATASLTQSQNELGNTWATFAQKTGPPLGDVLSKAADISLKLAIVWEEALSGWLHLMGLEFQFIADRVHDLVEKIKDLIHWFSQIKMPNINVPNLGGLHIPGLAAGGPMVPGGVYTVGERGPETVVMGSSGGAVIPGGGGGGGAYAPHMTFNIYGIGDVEEVTRRIQDVVDRNHQDFRRLLRMGQLENVTP